MARDSGLEELVAEHLDGMPSVNSKALFGGWCWLLRGHLLCGARHDGLLVRVGQDHAALALRQQGIEAMTVGPRAMPGWVRMSPEAFEDDARRRRLIDAALAFVATLPDKEGLPRRRGRVRLPIANPCVAGPSRRTTRRSDLPPCPAHS